MKTGISVIFTTPKWEKLIFFFSLTDVVQMSSDFELQLNYEKLDLGFRAKPLVGGLRPRAWITYILSTWNAQIDHLEIE